MDIHQKTYGIGILPEELEENGIGIEMTEGEMEELEELAKIPDEIKESPEETYVEGQGDVYNSEARRKSRQDKANDKFSEFQGEFDAPQEESDTEIESQERMNDLLKEIHGDDYAEEGIKEEVVVKEFSSEETEDENDPYANRRITIKGAEKLVHDKTVDLRKEVKGFNKISNLLKDDFEEIRKFYNEDKEKIEKAVKTIQKFMKLTKEQESEKARIEKLKFVNLEDFTDNERDGLKSIFQEKLHSYEYTLREVNMLSDKTIDKTRVFRMARKILMSALNMIDTTSVTYLKLTKIVEPNMEIGKQIENLYQDFLRDTYRMNILENKIREIIIANEEVINRMIDLFISIAEKKESLNFTPIAGIKIAKEEAIDIYEYINSDK